MLLVRHMTTPSPSFFFFFSATAPTEIYTLSLHDALPISLERGAQRVALELSDRGAFVDLDREIVPYRRRSEEHTSELQSRQYLVCRLLLEKKNELARERHEEVGVEAPLARSTRREDEYRE